MTRSVQTVLSGLGLATSWTWCIGMFAPIVIGQMFGWPGILAFAIPNVLGCALFGYLRTRQRSMAETHDHAFAMACFSAATVAYQLFFIGWLGGPVLAEAMTTERTDGALLGVLVVFGAALALAHLPRPMLWALAALGFVASLATFAFLPWGRMNPLPATGEHSPMQLAYVLPTIVFGFMLSPNLDLTFHRARQEVPEGARPTNFLVFGVAFATMLLLTVCYLKSPQGLTNPAVRAHIVLQLILTSALHLSEIRATALGGRTRGVLIFLALAIGLGAAALAPLEDTYLRFLGLYGLVFPAYAALAIRTVGRPSLWAILGLGVVVAAVVPIIDDAFLNGPSLAAPLAVILPLAAVAFLGRRSGRRAGVGSDSLAKST
jgi:hypothetical protein